MIHPLLLAAAVTVVALLARAVIRWSRELAASRDRLRCVEAELRVSERRFSTIFTSNPLPLFVASMKDRLILDVNAEFERITGYDRSSMIGREFGSLRFIAAPSGDDGNTPGSPSPRKEVTDIRHEEIQYHTPAGVRRAALCAGSVIDFAGEPAALVSLNDITERQWLEQELTQKAFHDPLTNLANRALFRNRVKHALTRCGRSGKSIAILFLDLDEFKGINDTHGHSIGDDLLRAIGDRLTNGARAVDTCARLGGDEFAILMEDVSSRAEPERLAQRLIALLHAPIHLKNTVARVGVSIGVAVGEAGASVEDVLRNADIAMYVSKKDGKGRCTVFEPHMHRAVVDRMELAADLEVAIEQGELHLAYQPIVSIASGDVVGMEALVRWDHPTRGAVSPLEFIPAAEESGAIVTLGGWILNEACEACRQAHDAGGRAEPLWVSVNVSGRQIADPEFVDHVRDALFDSGLPASSLVIEITEGVLVNNDPATIKRLWQLKQLGVRLAIDDFGTGYSSLAYLQRFPLDILKIDKSFIERLADGRQEGALARAVVGLGKALDVLTIAEGIESPEQWRLLRELGCELGQGYLISPPTDATTARAASSPASQAVSSAGTTELPLLTVGS
jgi:diguanylate cyclase (GGDEF)-like protein/PAS domain S-box-containing protein